MVIEAHRALLTYLGRELCRLLTPMFRAPPPAAMQRLLDQISDPVPSSKPRWSVPAIADRTAAEDPRVRALLLFAARDARFESQRRTAMSRSALAANNEAQPLH